MRLHDIRAGSGWQLATAQLSCTVRCVLVLMVLNAGVVTTALAQAQPPAPNSTSDALAEIIVTAQKRSENLQDVPIAITAVTRDQLQAANLVTANDLPTLVSGLSIGDTALYFQPHLRGIGTAAFGPGVENPVALYVDGVYYPSQLEAPTDLVDVSQISVLKGPVMRAQHRMLAPLSRSERGEFMRMLGKLVATNNDLSRAPAVADAAGS